MHPRHYQAHRWSVILAGGEGVRLRSLTRLISGDDRPKQFCPITRGKSLLGQTRARIAPYIDPKQTMLVLLNSHEPYFSQELDSRNYDQMLVQPRNRGTVAAVLFGLAGIMKRDPDALAAFFPSDHHYRDERGFMAGVELAYDAAAADPDSVILLGVPADHPETSYGWMEAEPAVASTLGSSVLKLKRFWEKPSRNLALHLMERRCFWNTFVMVARAKALWDMIYSATPAVAQHFEPLREPGFENEAGEARRAYDAISSADFSGLVLSRALPQLRVLCLGDVGWSDLGEPQRVMDVLSTRGVDSERLAALAAGA